jgi:Leucine-rich repeat (LRR) protein
MSTTVIFNLFLKGSKVDQSTNELDCNSITGLSSLKKLVITQLKQFTRIISLPATLEHIELSVNSIKEIEPNAFSHLNKLKHLYLDNTQLTSDQIFPALVHLVNLEQLFLRCNNMDSFEWLKNIRLPRLRVLNLRYNKVARLSKQTFATLPGLVNLDLGDNEIMEIEAGAFDGLINLRVLNLIDNKLKVFYFNVFESAANNLGPPVNLLDFYLGSYSFESVQWSPETIMLVDESSKTEEMKKSEIDEATRLFAKCSFRNKLDIQIRGIKNHSFVQALAVMNLVGWSCFHWFTPV